jgi:hypothetical protein
MRSLLTVLAALLILAPAARATEIDLQWSLCGASPAAVLSLLGDAGAAASKKARVTYYDSNPPSYGAAGLSFRTKGKPGKEKSSVKVRFPGPNAGVPPEADCSWDRYGDAETYTCEETAPLDGGSPWSAAQKAFAGRYHAVDWTTLAAWGPYANPKWKLTVSGHKAVFDTVEAAGLHLMELSVKVPRADGDAVYRSVSSDLRARGVTLCPVQEGKTERLFRALGL